MPDAPMENPYHQLLEIPKEILSPNHYELLGFDHRTSDPASIHAAAADQIHKLLAWKTSDHQNEVNRLRSEIAAARDTLLDEAARSKYDASLGDWGLVEAGPWIVEEPPEPEPLSVKCPDCVASFKLRNRDLIGQRVPCPSCGFRFTIRPEAQILEVVPISSTDDADLAKLDDFSDSGEVPQPIQPDKPKSRRASKPTPPLLTAELVEEPLKQPSKPRAKPRPQAQPKPSKPAISRPEPRSRPTKQETVSPAGQRWAVISGSLLMAIAVVLLTAAFIRCLVASVPAAVGDAWDYVPKDCDRAKPIATHLQPDSHRWTIRQWHPLYKNDSLPIAIESHRFPS